MQTSINHQFFFPHPIEQVWEYLTKPELMEMWLMKNNFQPIIGFDFEFRTNPIPSLNVDGVFYCKVIEIIPFKKLSYSWKSGPGDGKFILDSVVVWKLQPKDKGTELFLEHSGFEKIENVSLFNAMNGGWLKNIQKIDELLKT